MTRATGCSDGAEGYSCGVFIVQECSARLEWYERLDLTTFHLQIFLESLMHRRRTEYPANTKSGSVSSSCYDCLHFVSCAGHMAVKPAF